MKFIIKCFEANYPESLGLLLIHNAPWVFASEYISLRTSSSHRKRISHFKIGIWKIIQPMLDPVVAQKVQFTKSTADLEKYIPADQLPTEMGGTHPWEYSYPEPVAGENDAQKDTATRDTLMKERVQIGLRLLGATAGWISAAGRKDADVVGRLAERREAAIADMRTNYWKLDPYVRARSYVDRNGALQPDGTVVAFK